MHARWTGLARKIVNAQIAIAGRGEMAMIDNGLMGGIELAHAVTSNHIGSLTASGERRLTETHERIVALLESVSAGDVPALTGRLTIIPLEVPAFAIGDRIQNEDGEIITIAEILSNGSLRLVDASAIFSSIWTPEDIAANLASGLWTTTTDTATGRVLAPFTP